MKMVVALIRPEQLPSVKQTLFDAQIRHMTATTVQGTGTRTEQSMYRGVAKEVSLFRLRLELPGAGHVAALRSPKRAR